MILSLPLTETSSIKPLNLRTMYIKQFYLFSIIFILFSCKPSNPETILGIKLGLPEKSQITDATQIGMIKTEGDRQYVDYVTIRGYLSTSTATNTNGIEILKGIFLKFVNPNLRHPNLAPYKQNNEWVSDFDIRYLIETYKGKYGEPEYENNYGYEKRTWKRGDMVIILSTKSEYEHLGQVYCNANASYSYKKHISEKMDEEETKNNKSI